jgi:D-3-phosphoglycerate dehydrogenase / 2-oxoglutarate reductase
LSQAKIAVIQDAVSSTVAKELLLANYDVKFLSNENFILNRESIFKECQIVWIHVETVIHEEDLKFLNNKSILATTSTGTTHIANEVITFLGSRFISLKSEKDLLSTITSTAELAFTFILMGLTNLQCAANDVKNGNWNRVENFRPKQVTSTQIGVIGYGRLGKMVSSYGRTICSKVLVWDIDESARAEAAKDGFQVTSSLTELLSSCDAVSIHTSTRSGEEPIITKKTLVHSRSGLVLVNTSRGLLVDEKSVLWGLNNGLLNFYFTDVLECEDLGQPITSSILWKTSLKDSRIVVTPHIGGASKDAIEKCEIQILNRLDAQLSLGLK